MTFRIIVPEILRWLVAACVVVASYWVVSVFNFIFLFAGSYPPEVFELLAGLTTGLVVVFAGSLAAPRHRVLVGILLAAVLSVLATESTETLPQNPLGVIVGGVIAASAIWLIFCERRGVPSTLGAAALICAALLVFYGAVVGPYTHRNAQPESSLDLVLTNALGTKASEIAAFYRYNYGGFIDSEELWRIDATPEAIAMMVEKFGLQSVSVVPRSFWRLPPHYWPRSMPAGGEAFQSPKFSAYKRGEDGYHYLMIHDKARGRAYVWLKINF
ncbi:MAG: hypothetical protein KF859_09465 [Phycisphaeraceae bacterium]|nr:hypothetical protein [Phycisphaeraceae bacterium]